MSEEVTLTYKPLAELARWPRNPKTHDLPSIKASLRRHGFVLPLVEDTNSERLVAGHGRLEALLEMQRDGEAPPRRIKVGGDGRWSAPVITGVAFEDEREAEAYLMADNHLGEVGGWDHKALAELLRDAQGDLGGTGFVEADLSVYLPLLTDDVAAEPAADDPNAHWQGMPEFKQDDARGAKMVLVHCKTMEDYEAFKRAVGQPQMTETTRFIWYPQIEIAGTMDHAYSDE